MTDGRKRFAIAGGGIGGLAAAIALSRVGIASTVYERRAAFPDEGAGIQIGPNGTRILDALGVAPLLRDKVGTPDAVSVRDGGSARELARLPLGQWIGARHDAPYWTAHRSDLHGALVKRAKADALISFELDTALSAFIDDETGISFATPKGEQRRYHALVAADGLWSINRRHIANDVSPAPTGKAAYRTVLPASAYPAKLQRNDVHIWLSAGAHAVHYPVKGAREYALVVIADDTDAVSNWSSPVNKDAVAGKVAKFAEPLLALVAAADGWRKWSLHELAALPNLTKGHAALLGDAAHPVLPFLAQGAVMALEDAVVLAQNVAKTPDDLPGALRAYEGARVGRVQRVREASKRNGQIYHLTGIAAAARNTALKFAPPQSLMARYDWLYGAQV